MPKTILVDPASFAKSVKLSFPDVPIRAYAQQKMKQADAKYQDQPKDGHQCNGCAQFEAPGSCKLVDGSISPNGWCQLFTPKG